MLIRYIIFFIVFISAFPVPAAPEKLQPASKIMSAGFPTMNAAAKAAFLWIRDHQFDPEHETIGLIIYDTKSYRFILPTKSNSDHAVTILGNVPPGTDLVAVYHTHPMLSELSNYFGHDDMKLVSTYYIPLYLGIYESYDIKKYGITDRPSTIGINNENYTIGKGSTLCEHCWSINTASIN